jgi:folylpolyglutamate synthase
MRPEEAETLSPQQQLAAAWSSQVPSFPASEIHVVPSIEHAVHLVRDLAGSTPESVDVDVLVTGSLHLVGGVMEVASLSDQAL